MPPLPSPRHAAGSPSQRRKPLSSGGAVGLLWDRRAALVRTAATAAAADQRRQQAQGEECGRVFQVPWFLSDWLRAWSSRNSRMSKTAPNALPFMGSSAGRPHELKRRHPALGGYAPVPDTGPGVAGRPLVLLGFARQIDATPFETPPEEGGSSGRAVRLSISKKYFRSP